MGMLLWIALVAPLQIEPAAPRAACGDWKDCRERALEAAGRQDYETFHDLAWRTVQQGPPRDPALMYLVARAQSLSGRPNDALVMIGRLVDLGIATDAPTDPDLSRMRDLAGWPALAERLDSLRNGRRLPLEPAPAPAATTGTATPGVSGTSARAPDAARPNEPGDAARFTTAEPRPAGVAYDAVSRRFVVASREARKLSVVDEFSHHVNTLSGEQAGFDDIAALEIDPVAGNLWVVSAPRGPGAPTLHKLQLVSGRVLSTFRPPGGGEARFVDVAVTGRSTILALDEPGRRLMRLRPGTTALEMAAPIAEADPVSLAPAADGTVYIAHARGIGRLDLSSATLTAVKAAAGVDLTGVTRIRWYRGSLVGLQRNGGACRAVRITLDRPGARATSVTDLDPGVVTDAPAAATIAGDVFYYLARGGGADVSVRRVKLR